jgi:hypothetical protein
MSSSLTEPTSTTASSTSSPSPSETGKISTAPCERFAVVACGAIASHLSDIALRRGWPVDVHPLPPLLHNHPEKIAAQVETLVERLRPKYGTRLAVGYADCGTYGALDVTCKKLGLARIAGNHCYDMFAGQQEMTELFEAEPGTYVLTDFLVRSFSRLVIIELGLDEHPELRDDYFSNYRRVVWLAQRETPELHELAGEAATALGLPLEVVLTGDVRLERDLAALIGVPVTA